MASVNWLCTLNNPEDEPAVLLERWITHAKANYVVGQLEKGIEGTIHL